MQIDIITLFPDVVEPYLNASILKRAQEKKRVRFGVHDLRQWGEGKRRSVDDAPFGGGPGMVLMLPPFVRALRALKVAPTVSSRATRGIPSTRARTRILLTSAKGKPFTQRDAERYAKKYDRLVILCGRYEGVDDRVATYLADEEISVGPYVLTGGELPALTITDAVTRLIPGVLGAAESLREESFTIPVGATRRRALPKRLAEEGGRPSGRRESSRRGKQTALLSEGRDGRGDVESARPPNPSPAPTQTPDSLEYPHYTRPATFSPHRGTNWRVPPILLSGDHEKIVAWREKMRRA